jgi:hypothetical protein
MNIDTLVSKHIQTYNTKHRFAQDPNRPPACTVVIRKGYVETGQTINAITKCKRTKSTHNDPTKHYTEN